MRIVLAALIVLVPSLAHADDRTTEINVGMTLGAAQQNNNLELQPKPLVGPRATLSWENRLLDLPDAPGYKFDGALVPELVVGSYIEHDRAEGYLGVGLRADLKMAQREQGLLKISARGAFYGVVRALVVGADRDPVYEIGMGEYIARLHTSTRVGFEFTAVIRPHDHGSVEGSTGGFAEFYLGWGR